MAVCGTGRRAGLEYNNILEYRFYWKYILIILVL
jgi:hypothetical protein